MAKIYRRLRITLYVVLPVCQFHESSRNWTFI